MASQPKLDLGTEKKFRLLTRALIQELVDERKLIVADTFAPSSLKETSYDVRIGRKGILGGEGSEINLAEKPLIIEAGCYAGIISYEKLHLPLNISAHIGSKRKLSYEGVILLTGSIIDPGYEGYLLFGLYNATSRKVVLPTKTKICTVTFTQIDHDAEPIAPDADLLVGDFPGDFINKMANTEVLPWARISDEVKQIQRLTKDILDLKAQYNDVLKPIQDLTKNVDKVSLDVSLLSESVKTLRTVVGDHEKDLRDVGTKIGRYGLLVNIAWGIVLIVISISLTLLFTRVIFPDHSPVKGGPPVQTK